MDVQSGLFRPRRHVGRARPSGERYEHIRLEKQHGLVPTYAGGEPVPVPVRGTSLLLDVPRPCPASADRVRPARFAVDQEDDPAPQMDAVEHLVGLLDVDIITSARHQDAQAGTITGPDHARFFPFDTNGITSLSATQLSASTSIVVTVE